MRRLTLCGTVALALCLALPGAADATKIKHRGTLVGVPSATVKFAVKKKRGDLKRITKLRFDDVPVTCADGSVGVVFGELRSFGLSGKRFTRKGRIQGIGIQDGRLRVAGKLRRGGKVAKGKVRVAFKSSSGVGCGTDNRAWKTRKK
ncbi:MAG: hypothetical protein ACRDK9_08270 [Solirubrobacterales bacterium]